MADPRERDQLLALDAARGAVGGQLRRLLCRADAVLHRRRRRRRRRQGGTWGGYRYAYRRARLPRPAVLSAAVRVAAPQRLRLLRRHLRRRHVPPQPRRRPPARPAHLPGADSPTPGTPPASIPYAQNDYARAKQFEQIAAQSQAPGGPLPLVPGMRARLLPNGLAAAPAGAPPAVKGMIAAGNQISDRPYLLLHYPSHIGNPTYDCSSSTSHVLWGGGRFGTAPWVSGQLMYYGAPGPGPLGDHLRQRRPRLPLRRRAALRHQPLRLGPQRRRIRAALATRPHGR